MLHLLPGQACSFLSPQTYTNLALQAASGIGKEAAFAFAEAGALGVAFADINEEGALAAAEESKKFAENASFKAIAVKVDITDEASVDEMVQTALKEFGRIDYSVNSAGVCDLPHIFFHAQQDLTLGDSRSATSPAR